MSEHISSLAGKPVPRSMLVNIPRLVTAYFALAPDPAIASQRVAFGTSGHRGSAFAGSFNEAHVLAIAQAVCLYRRHAGIEGPLFLDQRFQNPNHIKQPRRSYRSRCELRAPD